MFKIGARHLLMYLLIGLGFATVMGFMYMQYVYYDAMLETLAITNQQLGLLMTILGATGLITCIPGGMIADKFDCRKVLCFGLAGMMVFCALCSNSLISQNQHARTLVKKMPNNSI